MYAFRRWIRSLFAASTRRPRPSARRPVTRLRLNALEGRDAPSATPVGPEFRVNTTTAGDQRSPGIAADAAGNHVVVWAGPGAGDSYGIYAQRYSAAGNPLGGEFLVNTYTTGIQQTPAVAVADTGDFVVTWVSRDQDGDAGGVYAQRFTATGTPAGGEFHVSTRTTGEQAQPAVAADANGNFVIAWADIGANADGSGDGVFAQRYSAAGAAQGGNFLVNTFTTNGQRSPTVGMSAAGDFVVAWQSFGQDGSGYGVFAQRFSAAGAPAGAEIAVNTTTTSRQQTPRVAVDAAGDFVVAWIDTLNDGDGYGVYARRFDPNGVGQGNDFRVNDYTTSDQRRVDVGVDAAGDFVIAWQSNGQDGAAYGVYAKRYTAAGVVDGGEIRVNTYTTASQFAMGVAVGDGGDFVVAWQSNTQDGDGAGVYAQRFGLTPEPAGGEFPVNTHTTGNQYTPSVGVSAAGDYVVVWGSPQDGSTYGVYGQRYDAAGTKVGSEFRVNSTTAGTQRFPTVGMSAAGDFVVAWQSSAQDGSSYGVYAQRYDAAGVPVGGEFRVNTYTTGDQRTPAVAVAAAGDFVVTWDSSQDGSGTGVYAQRYDATGAAVGGEFRVNTYTTGNQQFSAIGVDAGGDFVVAWTSSGQDGDQSGVYAQRFDASGSPVGGEFRVNTYTTGSQQSSAVGVGAGGDFVVAWDSLNQDGSNYGVYAQRYSAAGMPAGGEFRVNTTTTSVQKLAAVGVDAAGDFVVAWASRSQDDPIEYGVYAQRYSAAGAAVGSEFQVNTYTTNRQIDPAVGVDAAGDFVVAWTSSGQDGSTGGIFAQRYAQPIPALAPTGPTAVQVFGSAAPSTLEAGSQITEGERLVGPQSNLRVVFSTAMATFGAGDVTDPANWRLTRNGADVTSLITGITFGLDPVSNKYVATLSLSAPLGDGGYVLTAKALLTDLAGTPLDGAVDADEFSEDFARSFVVGTPVAAGAEARVNETTAGSQTAGSRRAVAVAADGRYVVVWSGSGPGDGGGVFARVFAADGSALTGEFLVNQVTAGSQQSATVAADADGDFVVAWQSAGQDGSSLAVYARRFDAAGNALDDEFRVNTFTTGDQRAPAMAMNAAGNFVVAWESNGQDGSSHGIYAQRFSAAGVALGGEFQVNQFTTNAQQDATVALDAGGDFVVAWHSDGQDGSGYGVYARRYNADGNPLADEFRVNQVTDDSQAFASVALDADGDFVVAWDSRLQDGSSFGVYARRYDSAGNPLGGEFLVNQTTTGSQSFASVGVDADGDFVVTWESNQDGSSEGVYARRYDAVGNALGGEFRVNQYTTDRQRFASVAVDADGDFVVAWKSLGQDGDSYGVYHRRYVAPAATGVTVASTSPSTYGDAAVFTVTVAPIGGGVGTPTGTVELFSDSTSLGTATLAGGSAQVTVSGLAAGTYANLTATYTSDSAGFANGSTAAPYTHTVDRLAVTVTADPQTKVYGDAVPTLTYQVTTGSLVGSDALSGSPTAAATAISGVGGYAVTQGTLTNANNPNYDITFVNATLTVTRRRITVAADPQAKVYGDAVPTLTYQVAAGGLVGSDTLVGGLGTAVTAVSPVGNYPIVIDTLTNANNPNYDVVSDFVGANLSVTPRPVTVTAASRSLTVGDPVPPLTYTAAGLVPGDALSGAIATAYTPDSRPGAYPVTRGTLADAANPNYTIAFIPGVLTATPQPDFTATGTAPGGGPVVTVRRPDGSVRAQFFAFGADGRTGIDVAVGDVTGDGVPDVVAVPLAGGGPVVAVFDGKTMQPAFNFFVADSDLRVGMRVAAGDVFGLGHDQVVVSFGAGGGPVVLVFDLADGTVRQAASFFADDPDARTGVEVATADVLGLGHDQVVVGFGPGGGPAVRVFDPVADAAAVRSFFSGNPSDRSGVRVELVSAPPKPAVLVAVTGSGVRTVYRLGDLVDVTSTPADPAFVL